MNTTALELNSNEAKLSEKRGVRPGYLIEHAHNTSIKSKSQDIVISDNFLFSDYHKINDGVVLSEASRILKSGGLLILHCAFRPSKMLTDEVGLELFYEGVEKGPHGEIFVYHKTN